MPGPSYRVGIRIAHLIPLGAPIDERVFPRLVHTVQRLASEAQARWVAYALGTPLPDGKVITPRSGSYARSIQVRALGLFGAEIYSHLAYASAIEEGTAARDLKQILATSRRVRISKHGRRYLVIPFRWGTPGTVTFGRQTLPQAVHEWWRANRERTAVVGRRREPAVNPPGGTVNRYVWGWGDRLRRADLARLGVGAEQARRLAGMVNLRKPDARGGAAHSKYLTFRTMSEDSSGWLRPAVPGRWPARTVARWLDPRARRAIGAAVEADVRALASL
jgi:hypothetical protein